MKKTLAYLLMLAAMAAFALMPMTAHAQKKITGLDAVDSLTGADVLPCVNEAETKKVTVNQLKTFINTGAGTVSALNNGLTLTGATGKLGGAVIQNTSLTANNKYVEFKGDTLDGNPLKYRIAINDTSLGYSFFAESISDTSSNRFVISNLLTAIGINNHLTNNTLTIAANGNGEVLTMLGTSQYTRHGLDVKNHLNGSPAESKLFVYDTLYNNYVSQILATVNALHFQSTNRAGDTYYYFDSDSTGAQHKFSNQTDSTRIVQDKDSYTVLIRDGATNNSSISDNNGFAFNMTTGKVRVTSTTGGFVFSVMTEAQRDAIPSPALGETIINDDTNKINYWNGAAWEIINSAP